MPPLGWELRAAVLGCRCADFVLLNKVDMLKEGDLEGLSQIAASLNPLAKVGLDCPALEHSSLIKASLIFPLVKPLRECPAKPQIPSLAYSD